jgi:competence protein ComFC
MFNTAVSGLVDFLFPKDPGVLKLESMSPGELLLNLSAPQSVSDLGEDTIAIFPYSDTQARDLIWELKYRKNNVLVKSLAAILLDVLRQELSDRALFDNFKTPLLIPMPMSKKRRLERGWNQTEAVCEALKDLDTENAFEYAPDILEKVRHTESQTELEKHERLNNLANSMKVRDPERLKDRNVILLDDVTTTGASFNEACRVLYASGTKKILCVALAH